MYSCEVFSTVAGRTRLGQDSAEFEHQFAIALAFGHDGVKIDLDGPNIGQVECAADQRCDPLDHIFIKCRSICSVFIGFDTRHRDQVRTRSNLERLPPQFRRDVIIFQKYRLSKESDGKFFRLERPKSSGRSHAQIILFGIFSERRGSTVFVGVQPNNSVEMTKAENARATSVYLLRLATRRFYQTIHTLPTGRISAIGLI